MVFALRLFWDFPLPQKVFFIPIAILLLILNWIRYERRSRIDDMKKKWENEQYRQKSIRGWIIVLTVLGLIAMPAVLGMIKFESSS